MRDLMSILYDNKHLIIQKHQKEEKEDEYKSQVPRLHLLLKQEVSVQDEMPYILIYIKSIINYRYDHYSVFLVLFI